MAVRVLSFDTSTSVVHLALLDGERVVFERQAGADSADRKEIGAILMPEIDAAVRHVGWKKQDIDLIAVGIGPGSFTGIRVSIITARTLGQALNVGVVGLSTLETTFAACNEIEAGAIILSTTSNQFFYGGFHRQDRQAAEASSEPGCGPLETLLDVLQPYPLWFGDEKFLAAVNDPQRAKALPRITNMASIQAQVALNRLSLSASAGNGKHVADRAQLAETFPWQKVLPLYLRSPSVTVKKTNAN